MKNKDKVVASEVTRQSLCKYMQAYGVDDLLNEFELTPYTVLSAVAGCLITEADLETLKNCLFMTDYDI